MANLHVSNAVLDNCLSTLKHETMYYPSRIRQLIEQNDMESAKEVVDYYRELYNLLSQQAMAQVERVKLHLKPCTFYGETVLGDENLLRYVFELLKSTDVKAGKLSDMYVQKVKDELGTAFIEPVISKATRIAQAGSFNQSIYEYDPDGKATKQYIEVAQTLALRIMDEE